jgi:hypothetical protein
MIRPTYERMEEEGFDFLEIMDLQLIKILHNQTIGERWRFYPEPHEAGDDWEELV